MKWMLNQEMNKWRSQYENCPEPVTFEDYKWKEMQERTHIEFQKKFGGRVFIVYSTIGTQVSKNSETIN